MPSRHKTLTVLLAVAVALTGLMSASVPIAAAKRAPAVAKLRGARAIPPRSAPPAVKRIIRAANHIRHRPYVWGGGHRRWGSRGYDCSGSVSFALHGADLLDWALDSRGFMRWGERGPGRWVTIYANREHVFAVIAGLRWDTSMTTDGDRTGPGWSDTMRSGRGFRIRHPAGL